MTAENERDEQRAAEPPNPYAVAGQPPHPGAAQPAGYPPYPGQPHPHSHPQPQPSGYPPYPAPYTAWAAPVPQPQATGTNGFAIAALVTALTCFLWPVAIAFSVTGLIQVRKRNQRGTGLAVAGLVISMVGLIATIGIASPNAFKGHGGFALRTGSSSTANLYTGDCFDRAGGDVRKVPCSSPHDGEVVGSMRLQGMSYPGEDERKRQAGPVCQQYSRDYSMDDWAIPESMVVHYFYPQRDEWDTGDRETTCFLTDPDAKHSGSLRKDVSNTTSAQFRYLKAMDAIDEAGSKRPTGSVADDPAGYREWAATMATVLQTQTSALEGGDWEPAVRTAVDAQLAELKQRIPALQRAAQPTGAEDLARAMSEADHHHGYDQQKAVRKLLGLSTDDSWLNQPARSDGAPKSV
ncbi:DUF4190 domain-containing protein [Kitasatospora azatica]|uniref:DUF4190 domain-containing protein n=1 Tax=Kitasatospora azatica TaxID=58347 RepID=UPI00068D22F5|nr:DUF4190 domain-containing protein [Kitasatospora azatica]